MKGIAIVSAVFLAIYLKMFLGVFRTGSEDNFFHLKDSIWLNDTYFLDSERITGNTVRELASKL